MSEHDIMALWLTFKVAALTTLLLMLVSIPLAWWLAVSASRLKAPVAALVAMPLVLPPTVLGFYLLLAMGPNGPIGMFSSTLGLGYLPFTFWGVVIASMVYSLPFVVQPLQAGFESLDPGVLEAAATLGAKPFDRFVHVTLPLCRPSFLSAAVLGFAHTVGEFGVVLMVGGNIPEVSRVVSVQIYEHVESLEYAKAHRLSLILMVFSFVVLSLVYWFNRSRMGRAGVLRV